MGNLDWNQLESEVEELFRGDASGHDAAHTLRVTNLARTIARKEGADEEICRLAALLHDVDDWKLVGGAMGQSARAQALMDRHHVAKETQRRVVEIIASVSFKGTDSVIPRTLEGKVVQDADRLDAIGAIGVARAFAYGGAHGREMYDPQVKPNLHMDEKAYMANKGTTINHFYEKLLLLGDMMQTATGKEIAVSRHAYLKAFLEEFLAEWQGNR